MITPICQKEFNTKAYDGIQLFIRFYGEICFSDLKFVANFEKGESYRNLILSNNTSMCSAVKLAVLESFQFPEMVYQDLYIPWLKLPGVSTAKSYDLAELTRGNFSLRNRRLKLPGVSWPRG